MPRGESKAAKKPTAAKRPTRKAKPTTEQEEEVLPDLETFLVELNNWPDVTDILASKHFKEAMEQFSDVAAFRVELKECLAPCYGKKRIPRTPKKLAHKVPPRPIPQTVRVIDFELDLNSDATGDSAVIAVTGVVPQTPATKINAPSSNFRASRNPAGATQTQSPFNRLCQMNPVIASTPSSNPTPHVANQTNPPTPISSQSIRFGAPHPHYTTPKPNVQDKSQMLQEINQKLETAGIRHDNYVREQQERVARDNEQRKRRVNQNLQQKQQEEERKQREIRQQQDRVRRFEEAQRSPKNTIKALTPAKATTPAKLHTPGQKAVPQKRPKQVEPVEYVEPVKSNVKATQLPIPKPRPAAIVRHQPKVEVSIEEIVISVEEEQEEAVVAEVREESVHREEISSTVELMEAEPEYADKENQERNPPHKSPMLKQIKQDESAYEMTPEKVFQPSTENDYNVNDLSSGDETDNEDNPRKKVPRWAEKSTLRTHVQNLFRHVSKNAVNDYFGLLKAPKIATLFANNDKNYDSMMHNETTAWDSPIANPRSAPLTAKPRNFKN